MQKSEKEKLVARLRRAADAQRRAYSGNLYHEGIAQGLDDAAGILGKVRCEDEVAVIRCENCRFFKGDGLECHWGMFAYEDDFCSRGERRVET